MQEVSFEEALEIINARDPRYDKEAYLFVREALDFTQRTTGRDTRGHARHVTGQELVEGIRGYALEQFGPMTITVLEQWGIRNCLDFGEIVFNMVDLGLLAKTDKDSRSDFEGGTISLRPFKSRFSREASRRRLPPKQRLLRSEDRPTAVSSNYNLFVWC
jgi:uncharacterized repeat protein (TIGR04138 family)